MTFKDWLQTNEMAGTGAVYNGEPGQVKSATPTKGNPLPANKRDYNWWGSPESANKTPAQAQAIMNKNIHNCRKK